MAYAEIMLSDGRAVVYDGKKTWTLQVGEDEPQDATGLNLGMWLQGIGPGESREVGPFPYGDLYDYMELQQEAYDIISMIRGVTHVENDKIREICHAHSEQRLARASQAAIDEAIKIMKARPFGPECDASLAPKDSHVARLLAML